MEAMRWDPTDKSGPFGKLFDKLRKCKETEGKCPHLSFRSYYFEPNQETAEEWHNKAMFLGELDRRVVFVCESPGPSGKKMPPGVVLPCFNGSARVRRFHEIRKCYGLQNCYVTNTVKCGPKPHRLGKHTDDDIKACIGFLIDELELIQPMVAVGVGKNAMHTLRTVVALKMAKSNRVPPVLFQITHYSMHGDPAERWRCEFEELERLLARLKPRAEWKR